ncbi:MAG TPA: TIGR03546 family protein [Gemmatimonadales bacterium]|nr:TIGR03546 family protein [Gemmatimonadales bacterium]
MFALLKLIQSIIKTLHSEGTPGQVAAGMALGAALGLTPLMNVHNLVVFSLIVLLNVSFGGGMLGWALFVPVGFILDPVFHALGLGLLEAPSLRGLWTAMYNTPLVPYTNFNNSVVLGSVVGWLALGLPIFFAARWGVTRYRATIGERVQRSKLYKAITASKAYNVYRLFRPE